MSNFAFLPRFDQGNPIVDFLVNFTMRVLMLVSIALSIFVVLDIAFPELTLETKKGIAYGITIFVYALLILRGFGGGGGRGDDDDDEPDESPDDPGGVQNTIPVKSEDFRLAA